MFLYCSDVVTIKSVYKSCLDDKMAGRLREKVFFELRYISSVCIKISKNCISVFLKQPFIAWSKHNYDILMKYTFGCPGYYKPRISIHCNNIFNPQLRAIHFRYPVKSLRYLFHQKQLSDMPQGSISKITFSSIWLCL